MKKLNNEVEKLRLQLVTGRVESHEKAVQLGKLMALISLISL